MKYELSRKLVALQRLGVSWQHTLAYPALTQEVSVHLAVEAELESAARNYSDQMLTTSHTLSSFSVKMTHFFDSSSESHTFHTSPLHILT